MKFIIYGAGYRGKRLLRYLGGDRVYAFIDSDVEKQGDVISGKIVISFEEYKARYTSNPVIISPSNSTFIRQMFNECNIYSYSVLSELPSEFCGYGSIGFNDCYKGLLKKYTRPCYLFGINAFSVLLFYELQSLGNEVYFIRGSGRMETWLKGYIPDCLCDTAIEQANVFLCCYTYADILVEEYRKCNLIDAYDYTSNLPIYRNKKIERLKNIYSDRKRCFIVATGPSLQEDDLQILKQNGEFCFGVNKIFKMNSTWKPDAYVVTDSFLIKDEKEKINEYDADMKFIGDGNILGCYNDDNIYIVHVVGSGYGNLPPPFSEAVEQKVYGGGTVTYACIQIAIYMGFQEIYLLGVDCNYKVGSKANHFYEDSTDMIERDLSQMTLAFQAAQSYANMHGIKIYNATRGGALEVFDRVDFDVLFEK